ncbi:MAG: DUF167 domain-containing protein [Deltaproteobacteria bacterium]|nr:MAG: DUF167 domain-containing protein [Deltaproteobacteria bacterium]
MAEGVAVWIHVTPRARVETLGGVHGDALRVAVRSPPVDGAANAAVASALAAALGVPRESVTLAAGSRGRRKRVHIRGDPVALETRLRGLASAAGVR